MSTSKLKETEDRGACVLQSMVLKTVRSDLETEQSDVKSLCSIPETTILYINQFQQEKINEKNSHALNNTKKTFLKL